MATNHHLLDESIRNLKQHPDWTQKHLAKDLQERHGLTESKADAIARRALFSAERDSRKRYRTRRHSLLPGETSGIFDNIVRAMEDVGAG